MSEFAKNWGLTVSPSEDDFVFSCQSPDSEIHVNGTARRSERGLVISRVEWSTGNAKGITGRTCYSPQMRELVASIRAMVTPERAEEVSESGDAPLTDGHLRDVALAYLAETGPGKPPGAANRLAERFGRPVATIHRWILHARQREWLAPTWQGRTGGEPGRRLLEDAVMPGGDET